MLIHDDQHMGYGIPAGTVIFVKQMGMNMVETIFDDPEKFDPNRYMRNVDLPYPATFDLVADKAHDIILHGLIFLSGISGLL
jgi:cytochrome P450